MYRFLFFFYNCCLGFWTVPTVWYFLFFILLETFVVRKYDMPQKWKHINIGLLIPVVSQKKQFADVVCNRAGCLVYIRKVQHIMINVIYLCYVNCHGFLSVCEDMSKMFYKLIKISGRLSNVVRICRIYYAICSYHQS